jgi:uncharacterized protein (TIGR01244 family)
MKNVILLITTVALLSLLSSAKSNRVQQTEKLDKIQQSLRDDVPRIMCLDDRFATGGQPTDAAFPKLAANGYRVVLNLRTSSEGAELGREREAVEKSGMRYVSIPVDPAAPKVEQVDEFLKTVKNADNQPMFIHCGSGNRAGAFWMIYRAVEQGWPDDKAVSEATQIGLTSPSLTTFARDYIASHQPKKKAG